MFEVMLQSCVQYSELQWHQSPKHNIFQVLFNFTAIESTQFRCDNSSGQLMSRNAYSFSGARQEVLPWPMGHLSCHILRDVVFLSNFMP